ncbi:MAG TPA: universal stress protein [Aurantimonas coralicida]|mgnify:CR=1 FL=1|uniref:Universal stress protein n=2 Tax=root TaxID=1 RepID=A0A9C9ND25_9HYPH|nr:universal stress protein [Aurantimonas coralicida]HET99591.1 universal stress protein [Aurantimonas coralicida]
MSEVERPAAATCEPALPYPQACEPVFRHVLACLDMSPFSHAVLAHASAVASMMNARLTVLHVLEPSGSGTVPTDPVEWTLRHRDVEAALRDRMSRFDGIDAEIVLIDGPAAECICAWVRDHGVDLTVLGVSGNSNWPFPGLGGTARRVAEAIEGSVLLAPSVEAGEDAIRYRRVMTPLDGSPRAESSLPIAVGLAAAHDAEILLVHAAPNVDLTEIGPLEAEARALRDQLRRRNERVAEQYITKVRARLPLAESCSRTRLIASGDARHALAVAAVEDQADIIVLSSTGASGHPDISVGSVAEYLINHADIPILLVRGHEWMRRRASQCGGDAQPARLPSRALM